MQQRIYIMADKILHSVVEYNYSHDHIHKNVLYFVSCVLCVLYCILCPVSLVILMCQDGNYVCQSANIFLVVHHETAQNCQRYTLEVLTCTTSTVEQSTRPKIFCAT